MVNPFLLLVITSFVFFLIVNIVMNTTFLGLEKKESIDFETKTNMKKTYDGKDRLQ